MRTTSKARKTALFLFSVAALLAGGVAAVRGQSALDGFDPNANGTVRVVVLQPDGKILIGGDFTTLSPNGGAAVPRNRIARLNPDGTLDAGFDPNANNSVYAIAVQADGKILVSGAFSGTTSIGGQTRNRIARLDAITGLADSFNPNANGLIIAIALQADGKILVGGGFQNIGGQSRNYIARLDATTGLADSFDPHSNNLVLSIAVQTDGKILAGGAFAGPGSSIGGQTRNHIVRLDAATGLADAFDPNASGLVQAIAVQADGKILAGGTFSSIGGQTRIRIARLDATTGLADSFDPNANNAIQSIAVQADGKILAAGLFTNIGGQTRNFIARLDATTGLVDSFDPNSNGPVYSLAVQADGKILAGAGFTTLAPNGGAAVPRNRIARLEADGRLDQTLNLNLSGNHVQVSAIQPDGKILIGGIFDQVLGVTRNNIARLNTDGTLDLTFDPNASSSVNAIAVQPDGKILVGGGFATIGGQTRRRMARLDPVTGLADSFDPNANTQGYVGVIVLQQDGKILVAGAFTTIGGQARNRIARLDPATALADSFNPNSNGIVYSLALQGDGKIVAGGEFTSLGGQARNRIARLDPMTGLADSFDPNSSSFVLSVAVQPDGKIICAGGFFTIGGATRRYIARLDPASGAADSFNPNPNSSVYSLTVQADGRILAGGFFSGANSIGGATRTGIARLDPITGLADEFDSNANDAVLSVAFQADGKILAAGPFTFIGGQPRNLFARLNNNIAAAQGLIVRQSDITWTLGGATPQCARVTFESSTDNATYTSLGSGQPVGSNWVLTGLNFALGQNFYIRARGYHFGSEAMASESIIESVRNVFFGPLQLATAVSRKTHGGAGDFDIPLPLAGTPGVECRNGAGNYTLVFATSNTLVSGNASVTTGTGSVSGSPTFVGNTMTVNLTGVTDMQTVTVTLTSVTDSFAQVLPNTAVNMGFLIGDTNGDRVVNSGDTTQTRSRSGQTATTTNFRSDVNSDGTINSGDQIAVRSRSGNFLP